MECLTKRNGDVLETMITNTTCLITSQVYW